MITSLEHSFLSSSTIKELAFAGGQIGGMVPPFVEIAIHKRLSQLGDDRGDKIKQVSLQE
jgi:pantetheine-phosphate adenylyltransferase